jgi:hypothetical protein
MFGHHLGASVREACNSLSAVITREQRSRSASACRDIERLSEPVLPAPWNPGATWTRTYFGEQIEQGCAASGLGPES